MKSFIIAGSCSLLIWSGCAFSLPLSDISDPAENMQIVNSVDSSFVKLAFLQEKDNLFADRNKRGHKPPPPPKHKKLKPKKHPDRGPNFKPDRRPDRGPGDHPNFRPDRRPDRDPGDRPNFRPDRRSDRDPGDRPNIRNN